MNIFSYSPIERQGFVSLRLLAWKVAWNTRIMMIYGTSSGTGHSDGVQSKFEGKVIMLILLNVQTLHYMNMNIYKYKYKYKYK